MSSVTPIDSPELTEALQLAHQALDAGFHIVSLGPVSHHPEDIAASHWSLILFPNNTVVYTDTYILTVEFTPGQPLYVMGVPAIHRPDTAITTQGIARWIEAQTVHQPVASTTTDTSLFDAVRYGWSVQRTLEHTPPFRGLEFAPCAKYQISALNYFYNTPGHPGHRDNPDTSTSTTYLVTVEEDGEISYAAQGTQPHTDDELWDAITATAPYFHGLQPSNTSD